MATHEKKDPGPMIFTVIGIVVGLLMLSQCVSRFTEPQPTFAELQARAERQVAAENRIARVEGRETEREIEEYPYRAR